VGDQLLQIVYATGRTGTPKTVGWLQNEVSKRFAGGKGKLLQFQLEIPESKSILSQDLYVQDIVVSWIDIELVPISKCRLTFIDISILAERKRLERDTHLMSFMQLYIEFFASTNN
jgi:hypothetical protein